MCVCHCVHFRCKQCDKNVNNFQVHLINSGVIVCGYIFHNIIFFHAAKVFPGILNFNKIPFRENMKDKKSKDFKEASDKIVEQVSYFLFHI